MFLCQSHLNDFVNYMKAKYPNIKFTSDSFSFMNVKITRNNNQLVTSVLRNSTFSGVFSNFKSFFACHIQAWLSLHFTSLFFYEDIMLLNYIFKKKEYPQFFIEKCIKNYLRSCLFSKGSFTLLKRTNPISFTFFRSYIF